MRRPLKRARPSDELMLPLAHPLPVLQPQAGGDSPNTHPERPSSEDPERWLERQRSDTGLDLDMARRTCVPRGFPGESISSLSTAGLSSGRASAELKVKGVDF